MLSPRPHQDTSKEGSVDSRLSSSGVLPVASVFLVGGGVYSRMLCATRRCALTIFPHQLEKRLRRSKSQSIGGWSVTLATQTDNFVIKSLDRKVGEMKGSWFISQHWPRLWLHDKKGGWHFKVRFHTFASIFGGRKKKSRASR